MIINSIINIIIIIIIIILYYIILHQLGSVIAELTTANVRLHEMYRQKEQTATQNAPPDFPQGAKDDALEEAYKSRQCGTRSAVAARFNRFLAGCEEETK